MRGVNQGVLPFLFGGGLTKRPRYVTGPSIRVSACLARRRQPYLGGPVLLTGGRNHTPRQRSDARLPGKCHDFLRVGRPKGVEH